MNTINDTMNPPNQLAPKGTSKSTLWRIGNGIGFGFVAMTAVQYLISLLVSYILDVFPDLAPIILDFQMLDGDFQVVYRMEFYTILSLVSYIVGFTVAILLSKAIIKIPAKEAFPLRRVPFGTTVAAIFICLAAIQVGAFLTDYLAWGLSDFTGYTPEMPDFGDPKGVFYNILHFINMSVCAAFFEEFLCRGVILQSLRKYGDNFALIISALVFGIMHGNLAQAPYAMVVGLVMGYFVLYTGSLWPAMIAHFINNGMGVVQDWIGASQTLRDYLQLNSIIHIVYVVGGILGIFYLRFRNGSLFYVKRDSVPMKTSTKYIILFSSIGMLIFFAIEGRGMYQNLMGTW